MLKRSIQRFQIDINLFYTARFNWNSLAKLFIVHSSEEVYKSGQG